MADDGRRADARAAEVAELRQRMDALQAECQKASHRAAQAWEQVSGLEQGKRAAEKLVAQLGEDNKLLQQDIETLQSEQGGGFSLWGGGGAEGAKSATKQADAGQAEALADMEADLVRYSTQINHLRAEWEQERVGFVEQARERDAENARLRDQLAEQAPQLREQDKAVAAAVAAAQKEAGAIIQAMETQLLGQVESARAETRQAEEATAAKAAAVAGLEERLRDYEQQGAEEEEDVLDWLDKPLVGSAPSTPERFPARQRAVSEGTEDGSDDAVEEMEMAQRLRIVLDFLVNGPGPDRPTRRVLAEMAEACVEEAEALELGQEAVEAKRLELESLRLSKLSRAAEHRGRPVEELMALSNSGHEEVLTLAKAACESAGGGAQALLWALLAETAEQRLVGNQYKAQLQNLMHARDDQLHSAHEQSAQQAEADAQARLAPTSSAGAGAGGAAGGGLRGSGTGSGLLWRLSSGRNSGGKGSGGKAAPAEGEPSVAELMDAPNAHVGYLWKRGAVNRQWKHRWCELKGDRLLYYTGVNDATPRGVINLSQCLFEKDWSAGGKRKHSFRLIGGHGPSGPQTAYMLAAESAEEKEQWLQMMQSTHVGKVTVKSDSKGGGGGGGS